MSFTKHEFEALKQRITQAHYLGYRVAYPAEYAAKLGNGSPPPGVEIFSTEHLMHLIKQYEANGCQAPAKASVEETPVVVAQTPVEEPAVVTEEPSASETDSEEAAPEAKPVKKSKKK